METDIVGWGSVSVEKDRSTDIVFEDLSKEEKVKDDVDLKRVIIGFIRRENPIEAHVRGNE